MEEKNEKTIRPYWGGVFTALVFVVAICLASCNNGSSDSGDSQGSPYSISYSLGDPPQSKPLQEETDYKKIDEPEGIYLEFNIPDNTWATRVYIEGLGPVAEEVQYLNEEKTEGCFFYPFVEAGKEYTIRFVFLRDEDKNGKGFVIDYQGDDGTLGWFQTEVTAGANSKGEVRFTSKGRISVDKKGNFRFTEKPTFQNEHLLSNDWMVDIGLVEGVSWAHGAERKTKWRGNVEIPCANLLKQINFFEKCPWIQIIDFICVRPIMRYKHSDKVYKYQWDGFVEDIYYPSKADRTQTIDINNPDDVEKIIGTWIYSENEDGDYYLDDNYYIPMKGKSTETVNIIDPTTLKATLTDVLNKKDGTQFTDEEQTYWSFGYEDYGDEHDGIYTRNITISDDKKTITDTYHRETTPSNFFKDCELKLSKDGNELWTSEWSDKEEEYYTYIYKKQ